MKPQAVRQSFVDFFVARGHVHLPGASLVPDALSTTLFTIAGMEQFVPVFLGQAPAPAPRVVTIQRCLRVAGGKNDIESVGRTGRHATFLEMLGNFSFGEYYKREAIVWAWEYLTRDLGLDRTRLYATVYVDDDEAAALWEKEAGLDPRRISRFREDNFWDMGPTGPCGPCSEIFYDLGPAVGCGRPDCAVGCPHCNRYIEVWNLVFQQYDRDAGGELHPLPRHAIDTGMGFERLCMILAGKTSIFDTELYTSIIHALPKPEGTTSLPAEEAAVARRVIADHARAAVFLAADGVRPGNTERGYVMRFLMRRALRAGRRLALPEGFFSGLVDAVVASLEDGYPQLRDAAPEARRVLAGEENLFARTLARGEARLAAILDAVRARGENVIPGRDVFELHDTYGFPPELTAEIAREQGLTADLAGYRAAMDEQRERARRDAAAKRSAVRAAQGELVDVPGSAFVGYEELEAQAAILALFDEQGAPVEVLEQGQAGIVVLDRTPFYAERGGQAGDRGIIAKAGPEAASFEVRDTQYQDKSYRRILHKGVVTAGSLRVGERVEALVDPAWRREIRRHHTVTHLLQRALKDVLGDAVAQRGSAVFPDRTRFDFDAPTGALSRETVRQVEGRVNELIRSDFHRQVEIMPFAQAVARGAIYMKGEQYGDEVRVVTFGPSVELCGGTHVSSTGEIGHFVLLSESAIAAGVRRVEGLASAAADTYIGRLRDEAARAADLLSAPAEDLSQAVRRIEQERRELARRLERLESELAQAEAARHVAQAQAENGVRYVAVQAAGPQQVRPLADALREALGEGVVVVAGADAERVALSVNVAQSLAARGISAKDILAAMTPHVEGRGGGSATAAQGGGRKPAGTRAALDAAVEALRAAARG
jgi:alanyl-tRNA synthetase